jgi:hypothetical protein
MDKQDEFLKQFVGLNDIKFSKYFNLFRAKIKERGNDEIDYWKREINRIQHLDRQEAIKELLRIMKLNGKIETIQKFIERIHK